MTAAAMAVRGVRREKLFGYGRPRPLDGNAKARIMARGRTLLRRTEARKHYGECTAKYFSVLRALLYDFHNCHTGRCFPSYEAIAAKADCARSTVYEAIRVLERLELLTWVNRIVRKSMATDERDLFGRPARRVRVMRTSNAYSFSDPITSQRHNVTTLSASSKSDNQTGTQVKFISSSVRCADNSLLQALAKLEKHVKEADGG